MTRRRRVPISTKAARLTRDRLVMAVIGRVFEPHALGADRADAPATGTRPAGLGEAITVGAEWGRRPARTQEPAGVSWPGFRSPAPLGKLARSDAVFPLRHPGPKPKAVGSTVG
jgi:hypothetical protein